VRLASSVLIAPAASELMLTLVAPVLVPTAAVDLEDGAVGLVGGGVSSSDRGEESDDSLFWRP